VGHIFVTGASGFMGRRLSEELLRRGHRVRCLVRRGSEQRAAAWSEMIVANPLDGASYAPNVSGCDTFVHLVGVAHPSPAKASEFRSIDLASAKAAVAAAKGAVVGHFVYVSVAHPAPVMRAYIEARMEAEAAIRGSGLNATIVRPWYVIGPGRQWPLLLGPVFRLLPPRLGLVRIEEMIATLAAAVERPARGVRIVEVPEIRAHGALK
jgi:uncharacterized protein YbjT (DUF2867 family)